MAEVERFGVFLPSYIWEGDGPERARGIKDFARTVEELGFDSLFITDHLLVGKRFYSVNWLEPLTTLAVAAGATERVRLGTSILIMPLRNPVILAKSWPPSSSSATTGSSSAPGSAGTMSSTRRSGSRSRSVASAPTRCSTS